MLSNAYISDNKLARAGLDALRNRLPETWKAEFESASAGRVAKTDRSLRITAADGRTARLVVMLQRRLEPRAVLRLPEPRHGVTESVLVISTYLSAGTRVHLKESRFSFLDLTGNARIELRKPGLFIETSGATVDPDKTARPARSLRGPKAGRIVRTLIDAKKTPGVRELAKLVGVDPGYVSRMLALLDKETLIERGVRGSVISVDWVRLLRRWAEESPISSRGTRASFLEPRGLPDLWKKLKRLKMPYALTGSMAAARLAPVAPPRLAMLYVDDLTSAGEELDIRSAQVGANVWLIEPADGGVFVGARMDDGLRFVAPSQAAADLLTSPGRGPAEAEELIEWMSKNPEAWRG